jgi:2-(1,2-epoxy-1,2-dihydrophenyl)acetyl-CoA isomerase
MSDSILTDLSDGVLTLTLNRPKANAFNTEMNLALQKQLKNAARNKSVRVIVLTGSGKLFSAGQDLAEFGMMERLSFREHLLKTYNPLILRMRQLDKPIVGALNGSVAGAALGVALACDLRIAADNAKFVVGFLGIGLAPDSAVSLFLPSLIGMGRAAEYAFTNQPILAEQAFAWGMVNRLAPKDDLMEHAMAWAKELAQGPAKTMGLAKRDFNRAMYPNLEDVLEYESHIQEIAGAGEEHREGVMAFLQKRPPKHV